MKSKTQHILLADDDIDDCNFFRDALETLPLSTKLTTVHDGVQLMEYLLKNPVQLPNVLFLDINMPRMNGFECLAEIRKNVQLRDLPVVMLSTCKSQDQINIVFKSGAHIYVRKPDNFDQLARVIQNALPLAAENIASNGKLNYILNA